MDARTASRLYSCMELHNAILRTVRRYFSDAEDRKDARQEAWIAVTTKCGRGATVADARKVARVAIYNMYHRAYRARRREGV